VGKKKVEQRVPLPGCKRSAQGHSRIRIGGEKNFKKKQDYFYNGGGFEMFKGKEKEKKNILKKGLRKSERY